MSNNRAAYYEPNPELQYGFQVELAFRGEDGSAGVYEEVFPEELSWDGLKVAIAKTQTGDQTFGTHYYYSRVNPEISVKIKLVEGKQTEWIRDHMRESALSHTHHGRWMMRVRTYGEDQQNPVREFRFDYGVCPDVTPGFSLGATKEDISVADFEFKFETVYDVKLSTGSYPGSKSPSSRQHTYTGTGIDAGSAWGQGSN